MYIFLKVMFTSVTELEKKPVILFVNKQNGYF